MLPRVRRISHWNIPKKQASNHWVIRQNTRWNSKDDVLTGAVADPSNQRRLRQAKTTTRWNASSNSIKTCVPRGFVLSRRVRDNEIDNKGRDRGSLLNLGHDVSSSILRDGESVYSLQNQPKRRLPEAFFPRNVWNNVTLELKEGKLLIQVNDNAKLIAAPS